LNRIFVTYLANDLFLDGVLVLNISLKSHNKNIGLICLVTDEVSKGSIKELEKYKIKIKKVDWIVPKRDDFKGRYGKNEGRYMFTKLNIFKLPYEKILYLDADVIVTSSIEHLFENNTPAAIFDDTALDPRNIGFNGGVLLLSPSKKIFNTLIKKIDDYGLWSDQTLLNKLIVFNKLDKKYNTLYKPLDKWMLFFFFFLPPPIIHFNGSKPWIIDGKSRWVKRSLDGCFFHYNKYRKRL